jgi:hypothetical protein
MRKFPAEADLNIDILLPKTAMCLFIGLHKGCPIDRRSLRRGVQNPDPLK